MSLRAQRYIKSLPASRIKGTARHFLAYLADYHNEQENAAWPGLERIADEMALTVRHIRRLIKHCSGVISYTPGVGRGNIGRFIFLELQQADFFLTEKGDIKADKKGDISGIAIRKNLELGTKPLPAHRYTQQDYDERDIRRMSKAFEEEERRALASIGCSRQITEKEVFERVCQRAGITVARGLYLAELQTKWPDTETREAARSATA